MFVHTAQGLEFIAHLSDFDVEVFASEIADNSSILFSITDIEVDGDEGHPQ